jgi:hypothetical protein
MNGFEHAQSFGSLQRAYFLTEQDLRSWFTTARRRNQLRVAPHFIERGKPTQNALIDSFNGKFWDECLNQNWFVDLRYAREMSESWRVEYNLVSYCPTSLCS